MCIYQLYIYDYNTLNQILLTNTADTETLKKATSNVAINNFVQSSSVDVALMGFSKLEIPVTSLQLHTVLQLLLKQYNLLKKFYSSSMPINLSVVLLSLAIRDLK